MVTRETPMSTADDSEFLSVEDAYDRWASIYDAYDNPMVYMASQIVERWPEPVSDLRVFEYGCGTGRNLETISRKGAASVTGCDVSAGMLSLASRRGSWPLLRHDMRLPVPLPDHSFDLALFCLTLEHLPDLQPPLVDAKRLVRPGGRIHIIEIHPFMSLTGAAARFEDDRSEVRMPTYPHQFDAYLNAFAKVGLGVQRSKEWKPVDVGNPPPLRNLRRGPDFPLTLEFTLVNT
jgi:malonyl-CoA O-methyltransferase